MESRKLYTIGNLFTGYPWGVEAVRQFDTVEVHGPFSSENEADWYAHDLALRGDPAVDGPYRSVKVVKIETPQVGRELVYRDGKYGYADA